MGLSLRKLAVNLIRIPSFTSSWLDLSHLPQKDLSNPHLEIDADEAKVGISSINFGLLHQNEEVGKLRLSENTSITYFILMKNTKVDVVYTHFGFTSINL